MKRFIFVAIMMAIILLPQYSFAQHSKQEFLIADSAAKKIISNMTLKQKFFEMYGRGIMSFGASMIFKKKIKPVRAGGNEQLGIPPTVFFDGPRGVSLYKGATAFPVTMARGASWDRDLERRVGEAMGKEIRAVGGNYSGAVCMNLLRHPAWGRAQETYGEDSYHVGEMALALVEGIQKHHLQACAKHFAANSMENNRFGGSMNMSERTLHEVYLPHFKKVVQHDVASVMSAYNKINGEYCGHSRYLLKDILRSEWGFKGYITSDWQEGVFDAEKGIKAGMNIEMPSSKIYKLSVIKKLIKDEKISEEQIDELVRQIVRTKLLFANRKDSIEYKKEFLGSKEHAALALEVAEKSAVLLKNENSLLPIPIKMIQKILVVGSLADSRETGDHGSSWVKPNYVVSPIEGIRKYLSNTEVQLLSVPDNNLDSIRRIAKDVDAIIVIAGTNFNDEGEYMGMGKLRDKDNPDSKHAYVKMGFTGLGGDRNYLHLHKSDIDIIQAAASVSEHVVVVLRSGSAITVEEWYDKAPAILQTFYNGQEGGMALAKILFGDVNPSGKLPFTVPKLESDLPPFNSFDAAVDYGYYHGYALFDKKNIELRFPFGHGLSYTKFQILGMQIENKELNMEDTLKVKVQLKNDSKRIGGEVLQLYVGFKGSSIDRPQQSLKAFEKIYLPARMEGSVTLTVPVRDLAYYNDISKKWDIEKMPYEIFIGTSSRSPEMLRETVVVR